MESCLTLRRFLLPARLELGTTRSVADSVDYDKTAQTAVSTGAALVGI